MIAAGCVTIALRTERSGGERVESEVIGFGEPRDGRRYRSYSGAAGQPQGVRRALASELSGAQRAPPLPWANYDATGDSHSSGKSMRRRPTSNVFARSSKYRG